MRLNDGFDNDGKDSLRNKRVIQVSCGAYHSAALTVRDCAMRSCACLTEHCPH